MKPNFFKSVFVLMLVFLLGATFSFGQGENINLQSGNYDKDPYPGYDPGGSIRGTYTIRATKSAHTFIAEQFTINIAFPAGAVYAGGANLPAGFSILEGTDGSSAVVIGITGDWSGTGPGAIRTLVIPIKIVGRSDDQPTGTVLQWLDPFITENPVANSTGSPLSVLNVPLPVTLLSFTASKENKTTQLNWATTRETNSDRFEIERSLNGKNWNKIGTVASHGESKSLENYTFTDAEPAHGENLYRLRMVDKDMTFAYSRIRSVSFDGIRNDLSVYPNPSSDLIHIRDHHNVDEMSIIDMKGNIIYRTNLIPNGEISLKHIIAGTYTVKIARVDGNHTSQKIVVLK